MPEELSKLPKPQMRRLLYGQIRKNLILTGISVTIAGLYMRLVFGDGNKREYAEFYKWVAFVIMLKLENSSIKVRF